MYYLRPKFGLMVSYEHDEITPYEAGKSKKKQVKTMFDSIAHKYDFLNHLLSAGVDRSWRKKAINKALMTNPQKVLDIATGTGDMAIQMVRKAPGIQVTGLDLSTNMLDIARKKTRKESLSDRIEFVHGDSENLPFSDNTFDGITVAFGVRNFENIMQGLNECFRVLRPGGHLVVLEFSKPTKTPFKQLYYLYFKHVLPLIGKLTSRDPRAYKYLFESAQAFPDGTRFVEILDNVGFTDTDFKSLSLGICAIYSGKK